MKKIKLIISGILCTVIFQGCLNPEDRKRIDTLINKIDKNIITDDPSHYISRDIASNYILNYATAFRNLATTANLGGAWTEFPTTFKGRLNNKDVHQGLTLWFYSDQNQFKVAYDVISLNGKDDPADYIIKATYPHSGCTGYFIYNPPATNEIADKKTISTAMQRPNALCAGADFGQEIPKDELNRNLISFKNQINTNNPPPPVPPPANENCYYAAGFFHSVQVNKLINDNIRPVSAIRAYWGYDPSLSKDKNRLRIILIGVDNTGHNIWEENAIILERSWPPDESK